MTDPFLITGPAVISFSGGRASGRLLWEILQAHGGTLPADVHVIFDNTGREMPATLDFVNACSMRWCVPITWLEFAHGPSGPTYRVVNHNSASRDGKPFAELIASKPMLPNPISRFCTIELKIRTTKRYVRDILGWDRWYNVVGLRADEMNRVAKATDPARNKKDRWDVLCPLAVAGIREPDVAAFWRVQPFDLGLKGKWEGNCDGCFLKSRGSISRMMQDHPERMKWWAAQERQLHHGAGQGATFRADREDYATLAAIVRDQGAFPFDETMVEGGQECGMECGI